MKILPLVSIITPSYNQGQFIEATIQSVLKQTYKNIEYIIMDGGSTDDTMAVVEKYRSQIGIIVHEKDKGQSDAINKGFRLATGELIGWINSDDVLYPDCVQKIVDLYIDNPDGSIYHGSLLNQIDASGEVIGSKRYNIPNRNNLLNENYDVVQPGSFYATSILKKINYMDPGIHYCMDLDLWIRLLEFGPIYSYNDTPIATIRKWEGTKTSNGQNKFLKEIKYCIIKHGANKLSNNVIKINYRMFKNDVKALLQK